MPLYDCSCPPPQPCQAVPAGSCQGLRPGQCMHVTGRQTAGSVASGKEPEPARQPLPSRPPSRPVTHWLSPAYKANVSSLSSLSSLLLFSLLSSVPSHHLISSHLIHIHPLHPSVTPVCSSAGSRPGYGCLASPAPESCRLRVVLSTTSTSPFGSRGSARLPSSVHQLAHHGAPTVAMAPVLAANRLRAPHARIPPPRASSPRRKRLCALPHPRPPALPALPARR